MPDRSLPWVKRRSFFLRFPESDGMTLIEVIIAVLLFAVFSGVFLMVTEMMTGLLPVKDQSADLDRGCDGPALEVSCINNAFDDMVPELFEKASNIWDLVGANCIAPSEFFSEQSVGWPKSYDCIYIIPASGDIADMNGPSMGDEPGLFLAEARVDDPKVRAFWQVPVQRLFCWPYYKCVDVVK